ILTGSVIIPGPDHTPTTPAAPETPPSAPPESAPNPVVARLEGRRSVQGGSTYTFRVAYRAIDPSSLGDDDVTVAGPDGLNHSATLVRGRHRRRAQDVVATERVRA